MNILTDILSCAEQVELISLNNGVPKLKLMIENLKKDVVDYTENIYIKFLGRPTKNKDFLVKAQEIVQELKELQKCAENLIKKDPGGGEANLKEQEAALNSIDINLKVVVVLCDFNEKIITFNSLRESKQYLDSMKLICEIETAINEVPQDDTVELMNTLRMSMLDEKHNLLRDLSCVFKDSVVEKKNEMSMTLQINQNLSNLQEALLALFYKESTVACLCNFGKSLLKSYFFPIVDQTVKIEIHSYDSFNILLLTIVSLEKSTYQEVFANLIMLLEFLRTNFNLKLNEKMTSLKYIGNNIGDEVSELITKHCLDNTIPSNPKNLQNYKVVIEETEKLETLLKNCHIFKEDTASILKYAKSFDILFIIKKCQVSSSTAELIMKRDLNDMTKVGLPYNPEKPMEFPINELPSCSVSKSAIKLIDSIDKILEQAVTATDVCAVHLVSTAQNIVTKYGLFVPQYHSKLLQTLPQQVALFHNNCMYISHKLLTLNKTYSTKLLQKLGSSHCIFIEVIHKLRAIAIHHFDKYVTGQIQQIQELMSESGLEGPLLDMLEPKTEKCIQQCLSQQETLKTVWHKILSYPIYNKTMGTILDCLCTSIISSITKFKDIPSNIVEQLVEIIKLVLTRGPELFPDVKDVAPYVRSWYKLNELNFVLASRLVEINNRWADGKGTLALHFTSGEMKSLIRALFQNTDQREAVLAGILD